jgi:probable HAF family extracellular repeat protein
VTNSRKAVCFLAILLIASVTPALAQGTYTQIDVPGAYSTAVTGINGAGEIVGTYFDSNGEHGFVLSGGVFTTIDVPNAGTTSAAAINDLDQVVGSDNLGEGFLYDIPTQTFSTIAYPGQGYITFPAAINNAGTIAGTIQLAGPAHLDEGFELSNGIYTRITVPGSQSSFTSGVNNSGEIIGNYLNASGVCCYTFLVIQDKYQRFVVPGIPSAVGVGINDGGTIVGTWFPPSGKPYQAGFLFANGTFQPLRFPHENSTYAAGINNFGEVVGYFVNQNGFSHGFTWMPPADAAKK